MSIQSTAERLLNRDFVLLWQGQLVSQLGNQAFFLAMMYWTMEATGSASLMGLLLMLSALPGALLAPVGGAFADRHSRRSIIIVSDVIRGVGVLSIALLMLQRPAAVEPILVALFVFAVVSGVVDALFRPAISAAIPDLVPRKKLAAANSMNQFSVQGTSFIGLALGGMLYEWMGAALLFLFDGVTFLFSAASETFIRIPQTLPEASRSLRETLAVYLTDTRDGLLYVWRQSGMRDFLFTALAVNFFAMSVLVLLPFYVERSLGGGAEWYGYLLAAVSAGSLCGYVLAGFLRDSGTLRSTVLVTFLFGLALTVSVAGFVSQRWLALGIFLAMGLFTGTINVFFLTLFQVTTPGELRGRVMGLVIAISGAASPLGMGLAGLLGDLTDKNVPLLWGLSGVAISLVTLAFSLRLPFRQFLSQEISQ